MNHWLKKAMSLVATAALAAPLLSVSTSVATASAAPIKIGVALTYNNTPFWSAYISYEQQFASQFGVQLIGPLVCCDTYGSDAPLQNQQVKDLVNEGANAIVLNPEDASAMGPGLAYAAAHHVQVVSVDTILGAGSDYIVVRASNLFYGYDACVYIASKVTSGYVLENEGDLTSSNGADRKTGFDDCMAKADPTVHILHDPTLWSPTTEVTDAQNAINAYGHNLKAIFEPASGGDPGIIKYLAAKGYGPIGSSKDHVILISNDGVAYEQCYVADGWMDGVNSQPANLYAEGAVKYAKDAAQGVVLKVGMPGLSAAVLGHASYKGDVQLADPLIAPFVTKTAMTFHGPATDGQPATFTSTPVNNPNLWGNVYGKAHGGVCATATF
ncbi:MAG TPA: sugar ABC transporter substrate-binding protein [Acidimicrobiales bacterium]|nr:sugar ABC transporter substrate-binding protein [Acidimicrobiales bacterium]